MIGAGIFAAAGPAAQAAGSGLLAALALAGIAAFLNATTMAQLAAKYPESGGTYAYGRRQLGPLAGFLAGWGFVFGKMASCMAMALTFAYYAFPGHAHLAATAAVLVLTGTNYVGVKKTVWATRILLSCVLLTLLLVVCASLIGGHPDYNRLGGWLESGGIQGVLQAAGILFFAFAGYARVATLGEEVINPERSIPRAILIALGLTIVVYLMVIVTLLLVLPLNDLAGSKAPLALAVSRSGFSFIAPLVRVGAALASLSVLLTLLAGISRTVFAMASNGDLPAFLSTVHPRHKVPHRAEVLIGALVALFVSFADLRSAIGFSSFAILMYYAIANASALRLPREARLYPRAFAILGLVACMVLAFSLPGPSILGGCLLYLAGAGLYAFRKWNYG